jgi:hypothetical protein
MVIYIVFLQLVACLPMVQAAGVWFPVRWLLVITLSAMTLKGVKFDFFAFIYFCLYLHLGSRGMQIFSDCEILI